MMNSFKDCLNRVKAEDELKDNTKAFVRAALTGGLDEKAVSGNITQIRKEKPAVKKIMVAISSVAACALLTIGGYAYYNTPVNYVSLDINPSVEFGVNAFNRIVCAEAYNEDGVLLLRENEYLHLSLETAVNNLVQEAAEQGYILEDGSTVVAVTAESNNNDKALKLQTLCENGVTAALDAEDASAIVYTDCIELQLRTQARDAGVSPGKFRLIEILQSLDPGITVEQYKNAKVTDIITEANELMLRNENGGAQNGEYAGNLERIRTTAQLVQAVCDGEQEQNANGEQNQNSGGAAQQQNQEQNQNQYQSSGSTAQQEQEQNANGAQSQNSGSTTQQQAQNQGSGSTAQQEQEQNANGELSQSSPDAAQQAQNQGQSGGTTSAGQEQTQDETQTAGQSESGGTEQGAADAGQSGSGTGYVDSGSSSDSGAGSTGSQSGSGSGGKN
ncbi:hypothetical protein SDC9_54232 [bioreactor metagenome]|uniref:Anti-sigma factor RsgI-like middle domain-containing protein n=1 Tax=bioreactor metagenome TaxID=1076179 RepID=A0A644WWE4_9ZZZZ